jgi:hypothetical protein
MKFRYVTTVAFRCAVAIALLFATSASAQNKGEVDPAAVSDGLKAIFSYTPSSSSASLMKS